MKKVFLRAEWRKLIVANYVVDPAILQPFLPAHTELDLWEGKCYVSLVGFLFKNTRVKGIRIPFHVNFEEVNLRFYVRRMGPDGEWRRGVVFVKEIVPKWAITFVANTLYQEHYQTLPMKHEVHESEENLTVEYQWNYKGEWQKIGVTTEPQQVAIPEGSEEEFITEHYWGYTRINDQKTWEYQVEHPRWEVYPIKSYNVQIDTGRVYGQAFAHLRHEEPVSIYLAEGSEIVVRHPNKVSS